MPSWIFTHIDNIPDICVSCKTDFSDLSIKVISDESLETQKELIFIDKAQETIKQLHSPNGIQIKTDDWQIKFKLKRSLFKKNIIAIHESLKYKGLKLC